MFKKLDRLTVRQSFPEVFGEASLSFGPCSRLSLLRHTGIVKDMNAVCKTAFLILLFLFNTFRYLTKYLKLPLVYFNF